MHGTCAAPLVIEKVSGPGGGFPEIRAGLLVKPGLVDWLLAMAPRVTWLHRHAG